MIWYQKLSTSLLLHSPGSHQSEELPVNWASLFSFSPHANKNKSTVPRGAGVRPYLLRRPSLWLFLPAPKLRTIDPQLCFYTLDPEMLFKFWGKCLRSDRLLPECWAVCAFPSQKKKEKVKQKTKQNSSKTKSNLMVLNAKVKTNKKHKKAKEN